MSGLRGASKRESSAIRKLARNGLVTSLGESAGTVSWPFETLAIFGDKIHLSRLNFRSALLKRAQGRLAYDVAPGVVVGVR